MKFTPGPWEVKKQEKQYYSSDTGKPTFRSNYATIVDPNGESVAYTYNESRLADAYLISAGPDLFHALHRLHAVAGNFTNDVLEDALDQALQALAKALGEP